MRNLITITATALIFGTALFITEQSRQSRISQARTIGKLPTEYAAKKVVLRAAGRIEGRTDAIELRARIAEQIRQIHVVNGQWVSAGEVLISLDSDRLESERDLAAALLGEAEAKQLRVENGYRETEIETAKEELEAAKARFAGAEGAYSRAKLLIEGHAVSQQHLEDLHTNLTALDALRLAAQRRLETMQLPARSDDLLAAMSAVRAAESRLRISQINLDRSRIEAPIDGQILSIEAELGELTGPDSPQPLITMTDTSQLRTVAEVDDYDALRVKIGQPCHITSDGTDGILARGRIVEIEPRMNPKRLFGQWAGERSDTYSRRVWIDLQDKVDLPVGLPVDVFIEVKEVTEDDSAELAATK